MLRTKRNSELCTYCGREVLEFIGEFAFFDSYMINSSHEADKLAFKAAAIGMVHAACLRASPWGNFWRKKWEHLHSLNPKTQLIYQDEEYKLYFNWEFHLLFRAGFEVSFGMETLNQRKRWKDGYLLPFPQSFTKEFPSAFNAEKMLTSQADFTLLNLAKIWGLEDTFMHPEIVAESKLESVRSLKRYFKGKLDFLPFYSHIFISNSMFSSIEEAVSR